MIKLELTESGKIYANTVLKSGKGGSHFTEVTDDAIMLVFQHILNMKMSGDNQETLEFKDVFYKYGKPYRIEITLTPEEKLKK